MALNISLLFALACVASFAAAASPNNTVYIISNAETPSLELPGLTPVGLQRAQNCLPPLLTPLDIGLIVACPFDKDSGLCAETIRTATPTAQALGLNVTTTCGAGEESDDDCVSDLLKKFAKTSTQSILVVWDILDLDSLFENLDIDDSTEGDDDDDDDDDDTPHFDLLTAIVKHKVTSITSQGCAGLDGQAPGSFRRSLRSVRNSSKRSHKKRRISSRIVGRQA
ncbi:hypothetical protein CVT25_006923 [Psilocybe cyanescens]|uniref:Uncharacterized protein n=1 Tax=Psilocybe cyanescens TaxID=93625 RepID=A0A409X626_PSICY|nr:hypothetical protein CVT25_006923 [Psilocybe cyanescens]